MPSPRLLRIRSRGGHQWFLLLRPAVRLGPEPSDDILFFHPLLDRVRLEVRERGITRVPKERPSTTGTGRRPAAPTRKVALGDVELEIMPLRAALAAAGALLLSVLLAAWRGLSAPAQDWTPLPLPLEGPVGDCRQDRLHPLGVRFLLPGRVGGGCLEFAAGASAAGASLRVLVDGNALDEEVQVPGGWTGPVAVALPDAPPAGSHRVVEISPSPRDGASPPWAVRSVRFLATPVRPGEGGVRAPDLEAIERLCADPAAEGADLVRALDLLGADGAEAEGTGRLIRALERRLRERSDSCERRIRCRRLAGDAEGAEALAREASSWMRAAHGRVGGGAP